MNTSKIKIFLGTLVVLIVVFGYKLYSESQQLQTIKEHSIKYESKAITDVILAFRKTYQDAFIQNHINLDEKSIKLLPVSTTNDIAKNFSKLNHEVKISTVSNNPRNIKNLSNNRQKR